MSPREGWKLTRGIEAKGLREHLGRRIGQRGLRLGWARRDWRFQEINSVSPCISEMGRIW